MIPSNEALKQISDLVLYYKDLIAQQETVAAQLKVIDNALLKLTQDTLPAALAEAGVTKLTTSSGEVIEVKPGVSINIPDQYRFQALQWLRDNGFGDIIKNEIIARIPRGSDGLAQRLIATMKELGAEPEVKEGVHPATLKAFVLEQHRDGQDVPSDLFGLFYYNKATIK